MKLMLVDGGEPKTCDYGETWVAFPEEPADETTEADSTFFDENAVFGKIQIHISK